MATFRSGQPPTTEFFIPPSYAQIRAKAHNGNRTASGGSASPGGLRPDVNSPRLTPDSPGLSPVRRDGTLSSPLAHLRPSALSMQRLVDAAADALQSSGISISRTPSEHPSRPASLTFPGGGDPIRLQGPSIPNGNGPRALNVRHEDTSHAIVELDPILTDGMSRGTSGSARVRLEDVDVDEDDDGTDSMDRPKKKRRRFRRPRRNSTLDKVIRLLEDKRVKDESQLYQLQDMQLPQLRRVLNIIFVTLGVTFLLAVIVVIIYTTVGDV